MPLIATRGAASAQGFGEFAQTTAPVYIEDVFSTWLYTGNGSTQTITNGIDLSTKGGLVWSKCRSSDLGGNGIHTFIDTSRGVGYRISSDLTGAQVFNSNTITAFNTNGFSIGNSPINNTNAENFVSWTFREQPKFFDIVTYTGNRGAGSSPQTINHNLGSVPGCIIIKKLTDNSNWPTYHRSLPTPNNNAVLLNLTNAALGAGFWNNTAPTSTTFTVGSDGDVNETGKTYVAYLFAHDAGGFGLTGSDNVISCGSFTTDGSGNATVNLGYEPQWLLVKNNQTASSWYIFDVMRGFSQTRISRLFPNNSNAELTQSGNYYFPTATGFQIASGFENPSETYIYIAIRRGPMKTPTSGTSVFSPNATTATTGTVITPNFPVDAQIIQYRTPAGGQVLWQDRLRGVNTTTTQNNNPVLTSDDTGAESNIFASTRAWNNTGFQIASTLSGQDRIYWSFGRAPGFFDVVCYTGNGSTPGAFNHNLGVVPEMVIAKSRSLGTQDWRVWAVTYSGGALSLNSTAAKTFGGFGGAGTIPATSSVFYVSPNSTPNNMNSSGATYVAYLFASVAGVSKVGSYTGTGALQTINCGFTGGARFVLIKRTDSTGDWWVYDSARGISSGNDPYLFLNSTDAEVTGTNYVDTTSVGFQVTAAAPAGLNANGGSYIFLAVA